MNEKTARQIAEMKNQTIGVEVEMRRDLRKLVEARAVVRLEHVDEVGDEVFVEHQAVAEHLEGVLARVGIGGTFCCGRLFLDFLRFCRGGEHLQQCAGEILLAEMVEYRLVQLVACAFGAQAHKVRHAHTFQRALQLRGALVSAVSASSGGAGIVPSHSALI